MMTPLSSDDMDNWHFTSLINFLISQNYWALDLFSVSDSQSSGNLTPQVIRSAYHIQTVAHDSLEGLTVDTDDPNPTPSSASNPTSHMDTVDSIDHTSTLSSTTNPTSSMDHD
jgi:hypothetical protein